MIVLSPTDICWLVGPEIATTSRTRGIVRDVCSLVLERTTQFLEGGSRYLSTLLRAETWGACRARVQHSAELCCVVVVLSPKVPCDGYLLHVVFPLHRFPACSPDRSRTGSSAQWDFMFQGV